MVMEMQMADKTWRSCLAERFPEALAMEIRKVKEAFYLTVQKLEPAELRFDLRMPAVSMTHLCEED
eukprot:10430300-Prorocentrum_lima.AAC.1